MSTTDQRRVARLEDEYGDDDGPVRVIHVQYRSPAEDIVPTAYTIRVYRDGRLERVRGPGWVGDAGDGPDDQGDEKP